MVGVAAALTKGVLVLDAAVLCGVAVYAASRREEPGATSFAAAALSLAAATLGVAVLGQIGDVRSLSWAVVLSFVLVFATCWLLFAAAYTGEWGLRSRRPLQVLAALPVVGVATVLSVYLTGEPFSGSPAGGGALYVLLFVVPIVVVGAMFIGSVFALLRAGIRYASADLRRCVALAGGGLAGGFAPLLFVGIVVPAGLENPSRAFAATGLLASAGFGLAVGRYDLFASVPVTAAIARERLVSEIDDLVIVVDRDGAVVDLNEAAEASLDVTTGAAVGRSVESLLDVDGPVTAVETVEITAEDGRHVYEASVSDVSDDTGRVVGHGLVLRDVTDRRTRRQRLEVLNRVLRHNLRNDMTAVMGYADLLADDRAEPADLVERIHETADALTALGDKAREIEQIMAASDASDARTDAARVVQYIAAEARKQYPGAEIEVDLAGDVHVAASEQVVWPILWNLVENACEHADSDEPRVEIAARTDDRVVVDVIDDGPGIPENERRAISAGEEHPLSHGSGLGLWAVKWGANRVGGDVEIADVEPTGTRVSVRFPTIEAGDRPAGVGEVSSASAEESPSASAEESPSASAEESPSASADDTSTASAGERSEGS